jgi:hypothetical protein
MMAVPTWRERASQQAQDDLDGLVNALLPFAQKMLNEQGEFFPFGAAVTSDGETRLWSSDPDGGERPPSAAVQAYLLSGFRSERDHLRAAASCLDVRLKDSDAVMVDLEHVEGNVLQVFLPYKKKRFGRGVEYGNITVSVGRQQIWGTTTD